MLECRFCFSRHLPETHFSSDVIASKYISFFLFFFVEIIDKLAQIAIPCAYVPSTSGSLLEALNVVHLLAKHVSTSKRDRSLLISGYDLLFNMHICSPIKYTHLLYID